MWAWLAFAAAVVWLGPCLSGLAAKQPLDQFKPVRGELSFAAIEPRMIGIALDAKLEQQNRLMIPARRASTWESIISASHQSWPIMREWRESILFAFVGDFLNPPDKIDMRH